MAYFSNGSEGRDYEEQYCSRCINFKDRDGLTNCPSCPILDLHLQYNYDQFEKVDSGKVNEQKLTEKAVLIGDILEVLIPMEALEHTAEECSMFQDKEDFDSKETQYLEELRFGQGPVINR